MNRPAHDGSGCADNRPPVKAASSRISVLLQEDLLWEALKGGDAIARITAARDVLEDTELAITEYEAIPESASEPQLYLGTYGVLQAMQAQKDALVALTHELQRAFQFERLMGRRDIEDLDAGLLVRHQVVGHPVKGTKKDEYNYYGISAPTLRAGGFQLVEWNKMLGTARDERLLDVDLHKLIRVQKEIVEKALVRVIAALEERLRDG